MILAGHEWTWKLETTKSDDIGEFNIGVATVMVYAAEDDKQSLAELTGAYEY